MVPDPDTLDGHDFDLSVTLGERTCRQLIRYFRSHIDAAIRGRGFDPVDAQLLEQDQLDGQAWRLAETVMERVQNAVSESLQLGVIESPADHLADMMAEVRTETWQEWCQRRSKKEPVCLTKREPMVAMDKAGDVLRLCGFRPCQDQRIVQAEERGTDWLWSGGARWNA
jgi:hypothetical protein